MSNLATVQLIASSSIDYLSNRYRGKEINVFVDSMFPTKIKVPYEYKEKSAGIINKVESFRLRIQDQPHLGINFQYFIIESESKFKRGNSIHFDNICLRVMSDE